MAEAVATFKGLLAPTVRHKREGYLTYSRYTRCRQIHNASFHPNKAGPRRIVHSLFQSFAPCASQPRSGRIRPLAVQGNLLSRELRATRLGDALSPAPTSKYRANVRPAQDAWLRSLRSMPRTRKQDSSCTAESVALSITHTYMDQSNMLEGDQALGTCILPFRQ